MSTVKEGDRVRVHYTGKLEDGSVFDSSVERDPLEFTVGKDALIAGFQDAVVGMEQGESKTIVIEAEQAYGEHNPEMIFEFGREQVPDDVQPEVGLGLNLQTTSGQSVPARIVEVSDSAIKVDANHPLAGKQLTFDIELVELVAG